MEAQKPLPQSAAKDLMAHLEEMKQQLLQSHPGLPSMTVARSPSWGQHSQTSNQGINPKTEPLNYPAVSTVPKQKLPCPCAAPGLATGVPWRSPLGLYHAKCDLVVHVVAPPSPASRTNHTLPAHGPQPAQQLQASAPRATRQSCATRALTALLWRRGQQEGSPRRKLRPLPVPPLQLLDLSAQRESIGCGPSLIPLLQPPAPRSPQSIDRACTPHGLRHPC